MHYINRELRGDDPPDFAALFKTLASLFDGAYNIAFINAAGDLVVMRDPLGIKPLCYGVVDDLLLAASESVALTNMGVDEVKMLAPGEILIATSEGYRVERYWPGERRAYCFFEWIYFSNLATSLEGRSVYKVRHKIGRELAKMEQVDGRDDYLVLSVPETANTVANSFAFHLGLPVINGLLRNRYIGRTFIDGAQRGENVRLKFTPLREVIEGKKIFLVDDTLVRGTTLKTVIEQLREKGRVKEIHVRIGNPPVLGPCFYGIDMPTVNELFAPPFFNGAANGSGGGNGAVVRRGKIPDDTLQKMAEAIGADSLIYLSIKRLIKAVGLPEDELCLACVDTNYPTPVGQARYRQALRDSRAEENPAP